MAGFVLNQCSSQGLPDGTRVRVEYRPLAVEPALRGNTMAQVLITKGKVHRSIGISLAEAHVLADLLKTLPKPE